MVSRLERTRFAAWWWTVDRLLLAALLALMLAGIILSLAASPPVASRLGLDPFYFVNRHVLYLIPALAVMLATSFLPPRHIRRLAVIVFIVSLLLVAATLHYGAQVNGARRRLVPESNVASCSLAPPRNSASCLACCWSLYSSSPWCAPCATPATTRTPSRASPQPALPSCSGCNRPSTWR